MANNSFFTKSEKFKEEYCVGVVRIEKLEDIEGSDFLSKATVAGFPIVVRKDEFKVGDCALYAMNETQLNEKFISKNNLFELSNREKNANYNFVQELVDNGNMDEAKKNVGFFNKHCRVKMIKLRGCPSMGFIFGLDSLVKWRSSLKNLNLEEHVGEFFDTIDGELFVKAYVPLINTASHTNKRDKRGKKLNRFNRIIPGQFAFHYDTNQVNVNMHKFSPDTKVVISNKLHGTSFISSNVLVKKPISISAGQLLINKYLKKTIHKLSRKKSTRYHEKVMVRNEISKLMSLVKKDFTIGYGNIYSSRTVIKNQYINKGVGKGFYDVDVWGEINNIIKDYIPNGMIVYGEIVGYVTGTNRMIQKGYDYGCEVGTNKFMIYRIHKHMEDGRELELNVSDVYKWTTTLVKNHPELKDRIIPIQILYNGTLSELYPDITIDENWQPNVLERLKNDKEHFGMECNEPMCKTKVPREGIVIRIDDDPVLEAFKLKCTSFLLKESNELEKNGADIEMSEGNY